MSDLRDRSSGVIAGEAELLMRRIIRLSSLSDRWQRIAVLYRLADRFGRQVFSQTFCHGLTVADVGCVTGECCACRPDVFAWEQELLDRLPKRSGAVGLWCPFYNRGKKNCGIYAVRPFACRIYFNLSRSRLSCRNPTDATLQLFDSLKRHVAEILGPYAGGYVPETVREASGGAATPGDFSAASTPGNG